MARKKPLGDVVSLRLKEPYKLGLKGEYCPAGTVREFPKAEAERLLKRTELWEIVS